MEQTIKTKFEINDLVYFIDGNTIYKGRVTNMEVKYWIDGEDHSTFISYVLGCKIKLPEDSIYECLQDALYAMEGSINETKYV